MQAKVKYLKYSITPTQSPVVSQRRHCFSDPHLQSLCTVTSVCSRTSSATHRKLYIVHTHAVSYQYLHLLYGVQIDSRLHADGSTVCALCLTWVQWARTEQIVWTNEVTSGTAGSCSCQELCRICSWYSRHDDWYNIVWQLLVLYEVCLREECLSWAYLCDWRCVCPRVLLTCVHMLPKQPEVAQPAHTSLHKKPHFLLGRERVRQ